MRVLISIDDTDNEDSPGTGELAASIADRIAAHGWGSARFVSRHQLYVHPDIPYTSHNSAMCFEADLTDERLGDATAMAATYLRDTAAPGSDPGLCVVDLDALEDPATLIDFGLSAKRQVLTMPAAYGLARQLGVHLSEHGGTGQGVIGALAGAGLRLSGDDGRMRGSLGLPEAATTMGVAALLAMPEVDCVRTVDGADVPADEAIALGRKVKTVLLGGRSVLLVTASEPGAPTRWRSCSNQELKAY
ncbi:hypothetical protein G3580_04965 [Nitrogeniibacter mangrovi]|uniref:Uncharacterized protein n=1 Tax=Nitrogeniibacter mangrovi TaxID=2016596 RepID=A0A6C1B2D2_9RHOO|nr:hypothetical protein [Nitrogeniibacter mangrovi]QID17045.1 hypothetical protein G3580_04965 [Nitrogeniibacter mangrovi]